MIGPVRRTTIVVTDMDRSLAFYQEALGLEVFYDQVIKAEASSRLLGVEGAESRLVSLMGRGEPQGMVGLLQFLHRPLTPRAGLCPEEKGPDAALLLPTESVRAAFERVRETGARIVAEPMSYEVPQRGLISACTCYDPDNVLVALMRFGGPGKPDGPLNIGPTRRTSIVVSDLEGSLAFYRDLLGMEVFYDQVIEAPEEGLMLGLPGARVRMVSLAGQGSTDGMVGLMSVLDGRGSPRAKIRESNTGPDLALIFITQEMELLYRRLADKGADILCPPTEYEIPGRGLAAGMSGFDPDGVLIEFTQFGPLKRSD